MGGVRGSVGSSPAGSLSRRSSISRVHSPLGSPHHPHDPLLHEGPRAPPLIDWPEYAAISSEGGIPNVLEGWSALAKAVHNLDLQKIQDHKEDIDNLLVFAGLFSAVMTAFLIESYKDLRQNLREAAVYFLENIALQSNGYSLNANFVNSTLLPQFRPLPPFHTSSNSILVNILWFSSLTITLATASYGLLVKQWLREYLAGDYTSPQARLRIRYFRNPKLHQWKVFQIASLLPLLLQLSLALFLVGLCFFTAEQNRSVGHTTLPLVAGWGSFFIVATFLPAVCRGCPYKTSFVRYDESSEANREDDDVQMLVNLDSTQSDEILLRTMWTALQQTGLAPEKLLSFIRNIVENRIQDNGRRTAGNNAARQQTESTLLSSPIMDLTRLPRRSATSIMLMAAELLGNELRKPLLNSLEPDSWRPWMNDCIYILFSRWSEGTPIPDPVNDTFALILADPALLSRFLDVVRLMSKNRLLSFLDVFRTLQGALLAVRDDHMLHVLDRLARHYFCLGEDGGVNHPTHKLTDIVNDTERRHPDFQAAYLPYLAGFLIQSLKTRLFRQQEYPGKSLHAMNHLSLILRLYQSPISPRRDTPSSLSRESLKKLVQTLLSSRRSIDLYVAIAAGKYYKGDPGDELEPEGELVRRVRLVRGLANSLFVEAIIDSKRADRLVVLQKLKQSLEGQRGNQTLRNQDDLEYILADPLDVAHMFLKALEAMHKQKDSFDTTRREIRGVFQVVAVGLRRLCQQDPNVPKHREVATECLKSINSMDIALKPRPARQEELEIKKWAESFQEVKSCFPDQLIDALTYFFPANFDFSFSDRIYCRNVLSKSNMASGRARAHSLGDLADHRQQNDPSTMKRGRSPGPSYRDTIHQQLQYGNERSSWDPHSSS